MIITYQAIGVIHSPFDSLEGMPIQPSSESAKPGFIEIFPEFVEGLRDLEGFSHIYLLYHLHKAAPYKLVVIPFLDTEPRGVFATRAPARPNPIGLSLVRIDRIEGPLLYVDGLDILDKTPLLDIKPYVRDFEPIEGVRIGWLEKVKHKLRRQKADNRFTGPHSI